ncbi:MAG: retention module-containing protein, partial [Halomonas sp.]
MAAATIIAISGQAWARDEAGNIRELRIGDVLQEGEVLITSASGQVQLDFADGSGASVVEGGQEVAVTPELDSDLIVATEDASAMDDDLEALLSALDDDGDLLELLDATAAGAGAGGGGGGGSSFVRVARVAEETDPLAFSTEGGLEGAEFVEFDGGAVAAATDDADTVVVDTTPPTLTVDAPSGNDNTPIITGTSNEVGGTVTVIVTDAAGNTQELESVVGPDGTWSVEVTTPLAEGDYTVDASITDAAGNTGTASDSGAIDTTAPNAPSVTIANGDDFITADEITNGQVTVTIGLANTNAVAGDTLTVNGTDIELTQAQIDAGEVITQVDAPAEGDSLTVTATITDAAGNESDEGTANALRDTTAPTVTITLDADGAPLAAGEETSITIDFSEVAYGTDGSVLDAAGVAALLELEGLTLVGELTQDANDPTVWTGTVMAADNANGEASVEIAADSYTDEAGNAGSGNSDTINVDTTAPTVTITLDADGAPLAAGEETSITIDFSEVAYGTDGSVLDAAGVAALLELEGLTLVGALTQDANDATVWTGTVVAADNANGPASATIADDSYADEAGNAGSGNSDSINVDTTAPTGDTTTLIIDDVTDDNTVNAAEADGEVPVTGRVTGEF